MPQRIDVPGMGVVEFPDGMTDDQITAAIKSNAPSHPVADFFKSIPRGALSGLSSALSAGGQASQIEMGQPVDVPSGEQTTGILEKNVTGELHQPQGRAGRYGATVGEFLGNPGSYVGPGGPIPKIATAITGALGSEAAGQATEGTKYEPYARATGAAVGGGVGGIRSSKVPVPTREALKDAGSAGYEAARSLGGEVSGSAVGSLGATIGRGLESDGINAKLAPKTFSILDEIASPPAGSTATISNFETIRRSLGHAARDFSNPTEKMAATQAIKHLDDYLANIPKADIASEPVPGALWLAGQHRDEARGNYAAAKRAELLDNKVEAADLRSSAANSGQNFANSARQRIADVLLNPKLSRGYSAPETAQMERVTRGTTTGNALRRVANVLGGGGGLGQLMAAGAGGAVGEYVDGHQGGAVGAVGLPILGLLAKGGSAASTNRQIAKLDALVRSRSPLAEQMARNAGPPSDSAKAALVRALLASTSR